MKLRLSEKFGVTFPMIFTLNLLNKYRKLLPLWMLLVVGILRAQETFPPPEVPLEIKAQKIQDGSIDIDGFLNETAWEGAQMISGFTQREPVQSNPASFDTEVRVLFDAKFLYIGARCLDSIAVRNFLRVRILHRDFNAFGNDRFGVALDGLLDNRN
ncbi:MAG: hypothetical protein ACFB0A_14540, partial [Croceivirga sp.]